MKKFNYAYTSLIDCAGILILFLFTLFSCTSKRETFTSEQARIDSLKFLSATTHTLNDRQLSQVICGSCHLFPEPELLDKKTWEKGVLPPMALRLGFISLKNNPYAQLSSQELQLIIKSGVFPNQPIIDSAAWKRIEAYYMNNAPDTPLVQDVKKAVKINLPGFTPLDIKLPLVKPSLVTLIEFDSVHNNWYLGDRRKNLYILNNKFQLKDSIKLGSAPSDIISSRDNNVKVVTMGEMDPNDRLAGQLISLDTILSAGQKKILLDSLPRPVHISVADLNKDGLEDKVICGFGNFTGKLAWYERLPDKQYREHILKLLPGARKTIIQDLNADGKPDILALFTQGDEGVYAYINKGNSQFNEVRLLRFPPVYGSSDFEVMDFNRDGFFDILYSNGDNADYSYSLKKYHGIRLFLNNGNNEFQQIWFYPLHGATKALARDFDQDGDLDIVAIAFFPDYSEAPEEGFIYFENKKNTDFEPHTFENAHKGRWLTMEAGDFDQDQDIDIILGSFVFSKIPVPDLYRQQWITNGPEVVILINQLNEKALPILP